MWCEIWIASWAIGQSFLWWWVSRIDTWWDLFEKSKILCMKEINAKVFWWHILEWGKSSQEACIWFYSPWNVYSDNKWPVPSFLSCHAILVHILWSCHAQSDTKLVGDLALERSIQASLANTSWSCQRQSSSHCSIGLEHSSTVVWTKVHKWEWAKQWNNWYIGCGLRNYIHLSLCEV